MGRERPRAPLGAPRSTAPSTPPTAARAPNMTAPLPRLPRERGAAFTTAAFSAAGHLRDLGREVVLLLLDALAALVPHEARDGHLAARRLARGLAQLLDRVARRHHALLLDQRDLREPLVELALDH